MLRGAMLLTVLLALGVTAQAAEPGPRGYELPKGERALQLAWDTPESVVVIALKDKSHVLRRIAVASGELEVIAAPKSFAALRDKGATLLLSPTGSGIVALEGGSRPRLSVYRFSGGTLDDVNLRQLPRGFEVAGAAWSTDGSSVYVYSTPYVAPEQQYSIGRLELASGKFEGVSLKGNLDIVDAIAPAGDGVVVKCRGYRGEYPSSSLLALLKPGGDAVILHSQADGLSLAALGDGTVLAADERHGWLLAPGSEKLRAGKLRVRDLAGFRCSADGRWWATIADAKALGLRKTGNYLALQERGGTRGFTSPEPCEGCAFAPDSRRVMAVAQGGSELVLFELP